MNKPHKHAEVIKAWADGAQIQYLNQGTGIWDDIDKPAWLPEYEYRIKLASRYLNVYANPPDTIWPKWQGSVKQARQAILPNGGCVGYLEDKQDGSTPVFHYWDKAQK